MDEDVHAVQHDCQRCLFYSRLNGMATAHYKSVKSQLWFTRDTEESDFCSDSHYGRFVPAFPPKFFCDQEPRLLNRFVLETVGYFLKRLV